MNDSPYATNPEWADVTPTPQNNGPRPLVQISYPPGFEEAHNYFRAIQAKGEFSPRALKLTAHVIEHNSANYTAWYYRRRCLSALGTDLREEMEFTVKWSRECPKNYQVWYHRRWLIGELAKQLRKEAASPAEGEAAIKQLATVELENHADVMQLNDDYKNYNGWSHRHYIAQQFGMWDKELSFVEDLLQDDIRNNSAWNHRYTVLKNTTWPLTEEIRNREIAFTIKQIRKCANNESAWNYLAAFFGTGDGRVPWSSVPEVEALAREVCSLSQGSGSTPCRFAVEALARVHEARGELIEANKQYQTLKDTDKVRATYWDWRAQLLELQRNQATHGKGS